MNIQTKADIAHIIPITLGPPPWIPPNRPDVKGLFDDVLFEIQPFKFPLTCNFVRIIKKLTTITKKRGSNIFITLYLLLSKLLTTK